MVTVLTILMYLISSVCACIVGMMNPKEDRTSTLFWLGAFAVFFVIASVMIWL